MTWKSKKKKIYCMTCYTCGENDIGHTGTFELNFHLRFWTNDLQLQVSDVIKALIHACHLFFKFMIVLLE